MKHLLTISLLLAVLLLTGCTTMRSAKESPPVAPPQQGVDIGQTVEGEAVSLQITPLPSGERSLQVTVPDPKTVGVEAEVIMLSMGHGQMLTLQQVAPKRFTSTSEMLAMKGAWMARLSLIYADGSIKKENLRFTVE